MKMQDKRELNRYRENKIQDKIQKIQMIWKEEGTLGDESTERYTHQLKE